MKNFNTEKLSTADLLREVLKRFSENEQYYSRIGKVLSVDADEKTAKIQIIDGDIIEDVRLQQVASESGLFITPSINSIVVVSFMDQTTAYISLFSQIDSVIFQGGTNGGLIKISDIVTKLNNIENDINSLKSAFSSWVVTSQDGGLALKTATSSWYGSQLTLTEIEDLENDKFKH